MVEVLDETPVNVDTPDEMAVVLEVLPSVQAADELRVMLYEI